MKFIPIAEIRVKAIGQSGPYATRVHTKGGTLTFFNNVRENPYHHRRYVVEGADPEKHMYPIAQAREDMEKLANSDIKPVTLEWAWLTPDELEAEKAGAGMVEKLRAQAKEEEAERHKQAAEPAAPPAETPKPARPRNAAPKSGKSDKPAALSALEAAGV